MQKLTSPKRGFLWQELKNQVTAHFSLARVYWQWEMQEFSPSFCKKVFSLYLFLIFTKLAQILT